MLNQREDLMSIGVKADTSWEKKFHVNERNKKKFNRFPHFKSFFDNCMLNRRYLIIIIADSQFSFLSPEFKNKVFHVFFHL